MSKQIPYFPPLFDQDDELEGEKYDQDQFINDTDRIDTIPSHLSTENNEELNHNDSVVNLFNDLLAMVDDTEDGKVNLGPKEKLNQNQENRRYSKNEVPKQRGLSLPVRRTRTDLIKLVNQEPIRFPSKEKKRRERKKSMIIITERFLNTKGTENLIKENEID